MGDGRGCRCSGGGQGKVVLYPVPCTTVTRDAIDNVYRPGHITFQKR